MTTRFESPASSLELISRPPAASLRDRVRRYTGYREEARTERTAREIPSGEVALVISFGPSLGITDPRTGSKVRHRSFVAGIHDRPVVTESGTFQHGVEVRLAPLGAYSVLGTSMHEFANRSLALEDVLGDRASGLADRLLDLPTWEARFRHLDAILLEAVEAGPAPSPSAIWAWRRLDATSGTLSIATLAGEMGCSRKHLAEQFTRQVGVAPKALARVLRFKKAADLVRRRTLPLGDVAIRCGYADQAHFNREFREFAGDTPTEFLRNGPPPAL